jgi:hypothetical protein
MIYLLVALALLAALSVGFKLGKRQHPTYKDIRITALRDEELFRIVEDGHETVQTRSEIHKELQRRGYIFKE